MLTRADWPQLSKQIYEANKTIVDRDIDLEFREWTQGVFFNSGMFAGEIQKIFLDNMPVESIQSVDLDIDWSSPT